MSRHNPALHSHRFAFGSTVLERVLLAIIEAHTDEADASRYERLGIALHALTGDARPIEQDAATAGALRWMARERQRDNCSAELAALRADGISCAPRSLRELALLAAHEFLNCASMAELHQRAVRLVELFSIDHGTDGFHRTTPGISDPVQEALETEAVARICAELTEWNVPTRL